MTSVDELSQAIDSFGRTALKVKRERDILAVAFKKIRDILVEAEVELESEQENSARPHP